MKRPSSLFYILMRSKPAIRGLVILLIVSSYPQRLPAQSFDFTRESGRIMLGMIKSDLKKNYYDPSFHGVDLDARFKLAEEKLKKANSTGQLWGVIAQTLVDLNDSHTFFFPPPMPDHFEYGWQMRMTGERCFVSAVKPGSDAETKGLKVGDEVLSIDGFAPTRETLWKIKYYYYTLRPRPNIKLMVRTPEAKEQEFELLAKVTRQVAHDMWDSIRQAQNEMRLVRQRYYAVGDDVLIWKMPEFEMTDTEISSAMDRVKKRKALILDLRGNPGGLASKLERLVGYFFDHDVKIGDVKGRKEQKPLTGKTQGNGSYKGKLIVLVDNESASASELFARVMQLEKRGTVIGDQTAGAVMLSQGFDHEVGAGIIIPYGASITIADIIMSDGKSLEGRGLTPDETLLATAADLASQRDPVLAHAAELVDVHIDPDKAGRSFPIEWLP